LETPNKNIVKGMACVLSIRLPIPGSSFILNLVLLMGNIKAAWWGVAEDTTRTESLTTDQAHVVAGMTEVGAAPV
jgi:hypothetical protein